ncbi:aspartate aminotransferase-like [Corticium candelabrum]|uniref:aspartate aminotransferase-like n=1 Tax=Corticium candelabrum TaxID=121492 RepID=UPI002E263FCD|nr:aspartate aminotransferase-like [Corticium candelabrum]
MSLKNGGIGLIRGDLRDYKPAHNLSLNERIRNLLSKGKTVYHLAFGESPFPVVKGAQRALKMFVHEKAYEPVAGILSLREAICEYHKINDDLELSVENVLVGPGTKQLIFLLLTIFSGDVFLIAPSWITYKPQCLVCGHNPVVISTSFDTNWKITPEMLNEILSRPVHHGRNKLLIVCNPDNPSGTAYTASELESLSAVFRKHNLLVLSDEIYGRLHHTGNHQCLAKFYPEGTIVSSGISKWAGAGGWRLGYHIYPQQLKAFQTAVMAAASHSYSCASAPIQHAAVECFRNSDDIVEYLLHTRRIIAALSNYCYRELTSVGVKAVKPAGGYYMMPDFEVVRKALNCCGIKTGQAMCDKIFEETCVVLMPAGPDFLRPMEELTVRLCYVNFDGGKALEASHKLGLSEELTDGFLEEHCPLTTGGIQALKNWVSALL